MKKNIIRLLCMAVACLLTLPAVIPGAAAASAGDVIAIDRVIRPVGDEDMLIQYKDGKATRYGIFRKDKTITPLNVDESACRKALLPDINVRTPYDFGILPTGDYYEQVSHDLMQQGRFRIMNRQPPRDTIRSLQSSGWRQ